MSSRTCCVCKEVKPLDAFSSQVSQYSCALQGKTSYESRCKPCKAAYAREWRKQAPKNYRGSGKLSSIPKEDRLLISAISQRLAQAKERARKYNQPAVTVDREYLYQLYREQEGKCALSGVTLKVEKHAVTCLSLDQKIPGQGYVVGNVQWVAWAVNRAKGDMDENTFVDMCRQVLEYRKVQRLSKSSES